MKISDLKHGDRVWINANGCDPKCKECSWNHIPLRGIVLGDKVYTVHDETCAAPEFWLPDLGLGVCIGNFKKVIDGYGKSIIYHCHKPSKLKDIISRLKRR